MSVTKGEESSRGGGHFTKKVDFSQQRREKSRLRGGDTSPKVDFFQKHKVVCVGIILQDKISVLLTNMVLATTILHHHIATKRQLFPF